MVVQNSSNSSIASAEEGNTITSSSPQISPAIRWCFTLNNYTNEDISSIVLVFRDKCKFCIIGDEVGESGTPHLQGYVEFNTKLRPKGLLSNKIHWEKAKGDRKQNVLYCSKQRILFTIGIAAPIRVMSELRE